MSDITARFLHGEVRIRCVSDFAYALFFLSGVQRSIFSDVLLTRLESPSNLFQSAVRALSACTMALSTVDRNGHCNASHLRSAHAPQRARRAAMVRTAELEMDQYSRTIAWLSETLARAEREAGHVAHTLRAYMRVPPPRPGHAPLLMATSGRIAIWELRPWNILNLASQSLPLSHLSGHRFAT
ncbi:hypothetical protein BC826DRAFT_1061774 [Russula brevipes]|nr:hypothetical protein BC826DRAFT_1061774 [Russula brevipes]